MRVDEARQQREAVQLHDPRTGGSFRRWTDRYDAIAANEGGSSARQLTGLRIEDRGRLQEERRGGRLLETFERNRQQKAGDRDEKL